jgi:GDP-D-mannose dehydratase
MSIRTLLSLAGLLNISTAHHEIDSYQDPQIDNANFKLHYGHLLNTSNRICIVQKTHPDEIHNREAQSHLAASCVRPEYSADVDGMGALRILETIHLLGAGSENPYLPSQYLPPL